MKITFNLSEDKKSIEIISPKELSYEITRELVGYSYDEDDNFNLIYKVPIYSNNLFVLASLLNKSRKSIDCSKELEEEIYKFANQAPAPAVSLYGPTQIGITCPPVDAYSRALSIFGAKPAMRNTWRIPFSRLYDGYTVLANWQHPFLPKFKMKEDIEELIHFPIRDNNEIEDLMNIELSELYSVHYGHQINPEGFDKLKYKTAADLLFTRPTRYIDRSNTVSWNELRFGESAFIKIKLALLTSSFSGKLTVEGTEVLSGKNITVNFFGAGWLTKLYKPGDIVIVSVTKIKVNIANGGEIISLDEANANPIIPMYRQSPKNKITVKVITQCVREMFFRFKGKDISKYIKTSKPLWELLYDLHFPKNIYEYSKTIDELAYVELLYLQLLFLDKKKNTVKSPGCSKVPLKKTNYHIEAVKRLPFELTNGQKSAIKTFIEKLSTSEPEKMLLSADVGSGKTLCAQVACLYTVDSGYQSVLVGPTEILAKQLYDTFIKFISTLDKKPTIAYLSGKSKAKEKKEILEKVESGEIDILVGTHSVLSVDNWNNLGLVVIDEQQKFGSEQRDRLLNSRKDGIVPDLISQTATPIPRTTALAFYGDIELVPIYEKPSNRKPIKTTLISEVRSEEFLYSYNCEEWKLILDELKSGKQMFIVAPAVEEDSKIISVNKIAALLKRFDEYMKIKEISGKTPKEKQNKILEDFRNKEFNVLIASSIIEVGIDIPDATVMLVVGAERFGASSLHQIRGRVGRNDYQSYCFLVSDGNSKNSNARLQSLVNSNDGFQIALSDLSTRKEGDLLGTRQSGQSNMRFCDLADHSKLIERAQIEAQEIYNNEKVKDIALKDAKSFLKQDEIEEV